MENIDRGSNFLRQKLSSSDTSTPQPSCRNSILSDADTEKSDADDLESWAELALVDLAQLPVDADWTEDQNEQGNIILQKFIDIRWIYERMASRNEAMERKNAAIGSSQVLAQKKLHEVSSDFQTYVKLDDESAKAIAEHQATLTELKKKKSAIDDEEQKAEEEHAKRLLKLDIQKSAKKDNIVKNMNLGSQMVKAGKSLSDDLQKEFHFCAADINKAASETREMEQLVKKAIKSSDGKGTADRHHRQDPVFIDTWGLVNGDRNEKVYGDFFSGHDMDNNDVFDFLRIYLDHHCEAKALTPIIAKVQVRLFFPERICFNGLWCLFF